MIRILAALLVGLISLCARADSPLSPEQKASVFFLLGMTDEYLGHQLGTSSRFYADQSRAEAIYRTEVLALQKSIGMADLRDLWSLIDGNYKDRGKYFDTPVGYASLSMFENCDCEKAYLRGAILSFWDAETASFRLSNSESKAIVLYTILGHFDCTEVNLTVIKSIPHVYIVKIMGSPKFDSFLKATFAKYAGKKELNQPRQGTPEEAPSSSTEPETRRP